MSPVPIRKWYLEPYEEDPGGWGSGQEGKGPMSLWPIIRIYMDTGGALIDVTSRVKGAPKLTEATEEDLLELVHGDFSFDLDNGDHYFESSPLDLWHVTPDTVVNVTVKRDNSLQDGAQLVTVWAGRLDIPVSITFDRMNQVVKVKAYSFSKLLELADADSYRRVFVNRTGTVGTAGDSTATWNDITDLMINDQFVIGSDFVNETRTVVSINTGTRVVTVDVPFDNAYTDAPIDVITPYYRDETVEDLATALFARAGVTTVTIDIAQPMQDTPSPGYFSMNGLPTTGSILGVCENVGALAGKVSVWHSDGYRYDAATPGAGFARVTTEGARSDWTPYLTTAPAALRAVVGLLTDSLSQAWDYVGGSYYTTYKDGTDIKLLRNGVSIATVVAGLAVGAYQFIFVEYDQANDEIWTGGLVTNNSTGATTPFLKRYTTAGVLLQTYTVTAGYQLRYSRRLQRMFALPLLFTRAGTAGAYTWSYTCDQACWQYDTDPAHGSSANRPRLAWDLEAVSDLKLWTIRAMADGDAPIVAHSNEPGGGAVVQWSKLTGQVLIKDVVNPDPMASNRQCVCLWNNAGTQEHHYLRPATSQVDAYDLTTEGSDTVPYADFSDMSVQSALRQLALFAGCYLWVDYLKHGWLVGRESDTITGQSAVELPGPAYDLNELPVFEWYRASATVSATGFQGEDLGVVCGNVSNTKDRMSVDLSLPVPAGYAYRIGDFYVKHLNRARSEIHLTTKEDLAQKIRPTMKVRWQGADYYVYSAETDLEGMEVSLKAFGV